MIGEAIVAFKVVSSVLGSTTPYVSLPLNGIVAIGGLLGLSVLKNESKEIVTVCKFSEMNKR